MLINTLAGLAIGYVLDMLFGDPKFFIYPQNMIKALAKKVERAFRKAYADTAEAQRVAGIMYFLVVLVIVGGLSAVILMVCYKLWTVLGTLVEGIMCWSAISVRNLRSSASGVLRCAKAGNLMGAQRRLKEITARDVSDLDLDETVKCTVETISSNTTGWVIAPIFWIALLGGAGGLCYRAISIMDGFVGTQTKKNRYFGAFAKKVNDIAAFIPAKISALLMKADAAFLKLNTRTFLSTPPHPMDIYWINQVLNGVALMGVVLTMIVRTVLFFIF